jgi:hypothetical protein
MALEYPPVSPRPPLTVDGRGAERGDGDNVPAVTSGLRSRRGSHDLEARTTVAIRTWEQRELPLLEEILRDEQEAPTYNLDSDRLAERLGFDLRLTRVAIGAFLTDRLIEGTRIQGGATVGIRITPDGRRAVGQWPSGDPFVDLVRILEQRVETASDEQERTRMARLLGDVKDVGKEVIGGVVTAVIRSQTGLP